MAKLDQQARKLYKKDPRHFKRTKDVDRLNLIKMKAIVEQFGWPTKNLVGDKASHLAWLLVQHADKDVKFQEFCLRLIKKAVKNNQADKKEIAYLTDRILVNKNKPQVYGTQFYKDKTGKLIPRPVVNIKAFDKRRKRMGLEGFEIYKKKIVGRRKYGI